MSNIRIRAVLLLIALVLAVARVIQEGEENATCFPDDFETYRWVLAGNTWFAETKAVSSWLNVADECARIEPGNTSIGGPRNDLETSRIEKHFRDERYYMNVAQLGGFRWFWCTMKQGKPIKMEYATWTNWSSGEPNEEESSCGVMWHDKKLWDDQLCSHDFRGVCELRCDSL